MSGTDQSPSEGRTLIAGIPMYNSHESIASVVMLTAEHVDEVICLDDGSTDDSAYLAKAAGATVVRHRSNTGVGGAQRTLFEHARLRNADALILIDSDGQHEPRDIPKMLAPILADEAEVVIGSRYVEGGGSTQMPFYRRIGLSIINATRNLHSRERVHDTQSGFRAFSSRAIAELKWDSDGMESSLEILESATAKDMRIHEVPTMIRYDVPKASSLHPLPHGLSVLSYAVLTLSQKKPLLVFGIPGILLLLFGAFFGLGAVNLVDIGGVSVGPGLKMAWIGSLGIPLVIAGLTLHLAAKSIGRTLSDD